MVKVTVQWGKQTLKDVEVDTAQKGREFKLKLKDLTGVPVERQTVMGLVPGLLKDETDLSKAKIREGQVIKLLGSAEAVPEAPKEKVVFAEDLADEENAAAILQELPVGLSNLGNTCYANSSLQCLRMIPELRDAVEKYAGGTNPADPQHNITVHLRDLYKRLEGSHDALAPGSFISAFREAYPQFAEKTSSPMGEIYAQQDADEFVGNVIQVLQQKLDGSKESQNLVSNLFRGEFETKLKCAEADEAPTVTTESFTRLSCFIEQQTNNLIYGLAQSLTGTVEKQSPTLQRSAVYQKTQKIKKLPNYMIVNFVRFFWKSKQQVKAKILRDVKFPIVLDTLDLCSDDLKESLKPTREALRKEKEQQLMSKYKESSKKEESATTTATSSASGEKMEIEGASSSTVATEVNTPTGWYELCGVVTHKGRTADSGHYIGWVKDAKGRWVKFDDDKVSEVTEEEIKKLSGGGDWHTAYLLFYRTMKTAP